MEFEQYSSFRDRMMKSIDNPQKELTEEEIWDDVESILEEFETKNRGE